MQTNPQLQLAHDFVQYTSKNVFLTGKAGTGKTTFLHNLRKNTPKRMAIVAPTGVAAINAGGVTIHSFFQLPFGPYLPNNVAGINESQAYNKKFRSDKIKLIRSLDLLVIDEISMVRADVLDGIDDVLRRYRNPRLPFGGLQLLMIGDLHQLAPIVKDEEWNLLRTYYDTMYFFGSRALQQSVPVTIELKEIFRQRDEYFIKILNKVRENQLDHHTLIELNQRYIPDFIQQDDDDYITLTTHNYSAQNINQKKLNLLDDELHKFTAIIKGDFPEYAYPTDFELSLKENAQVMFVKNDTSREKLFFNGKIGRITKIKDDEIYVKCKDEKFEITVNRLEWQNLKYSLGDDKQVKEELIGSFTQFPLKLAWAITIHKSQGLTFERAIIDANASFAHGQVYVALSRCKTFEGMILRSPINEASVKTDEKINAYTKEIDNNIPDATFLFDEKRNFQTLLLNDLFEFDSLKRSIFYANKGIEENQSTIESSAGIILKTATALFEKEIFEINRKFTTQFTELLLQHELPEENITLQERIKKASGYFYEKLKIVYTQLKDIYIETDNKTVKNQITENINHLKTDVFEKLCCLKNAATGFNSITHIQAKANAEIDYQKELRTSFSTPQKTNVASTHANLLSILRNWRDQTAQENDVDVYMIIARKSMEELAEKMPATLKELATIKGIGKAKVKSFGEEILNIIADYCSKNNIQRNIINLPDEEALEKPAKKKESGSPTKNISLELFKQGKTIGQIADERKLTTGTIESHLAHFVGTGELDALQLISKEKLESILHFINANGEMNSTEIKTKLGDSVGYNDIRIVQKYNERKKGTNKEPAL